MLAVEDLLLEKRQQIERQRAVLHGRRHAVQLTDLAVFSEILPALGELFSGCGCKWGNDGYRRTVGDRRRVGHSGRRWRRGRRLGGNWARRSLAQHGHDTQKQDTGHYDQQHNSLHNALRYMRNIQKNTYLQNPLPFNAALTGYEPFPAL